MSSNKNRNESSLFFKKFKEKIFEFFTGEVINYSGVNSAASQKKLDELNSLETFQNQKSQDFRFEQNLTNSSFLKNSESSASPNKNFQKNSIAGPSNRSKSSRSANRTSRFTENSKQQVVSITYEEIGLFPRSFNRVFDRFFKQLFFDVENLVIQEYRFYRYLFLTTVRCVFILLFVPLTMNFLAKNYLVRPLTEYYWNTHQPEIFLNSYQQKRAFTELQDFEEKIYFESLILTNSGSSNKLAFYKHPFSNSSSQPSRIETEFFEKNDSDMRFSTPETSKNKKNQREGQTRENNFVPVFLKFSTNSEDSFADSKKNSRSISNIDFETPYAVFSESVQNRFHEKILELAVHYNKESIEAITNFFADLISFSTLCYLFFALEIQINITKSFLLEVFFGLDDSKKSLFILFLTDLLVGYHSPNIWELFFSSLFDHYGLPESQTTIFLLVATLPVLLDVLFKYLIFRHLNRASPATVATYHAMIE